MNELEEDIFNEEDDDNASLYEHYRIICDKGQSLMRLDKFLMDRVPNVTRNKVQKGIDDGYVLVNDKIVKQSYQVKPFDEIVISFPQPPRENVILPEDIPLDIVYEDNYLLIINKKPGMVVHPAYGNWSGTLVNALVYHFQNLPTSQNGEGRPGLVHRIDKDTSGLLVIAKTELAMMGLAKQFFHHTIERTYNALVWGELKEEAGTIDAHVGRSFKDRRITDVFPDGSHGKNAITHYKLLKDLRYVSLIQCNLETGRTHQIRAHMKYLGHPLFNDATYGGDKILRGSTQGSKFNAFVENCFKLIPRQALHAKSLGFNHPITNEWMQFDTELPDDFVAVIEKWENFVKYE